VPNRIDGVPFVFSNTVFAGRRRVALAAAHSSTFRRVPVSTP